MSRVRTISTFAAAAIALVGAFEGVRYAAYRDPVGIPTICYGETKNVRMGMKATKAECDEKLMESLVEHENGMLKCLKVKLPDGPHLAFLSFTYNVGVGAFCKSTLLKKANAGDTRGACNELRKWDKAKGLRLPGLTKRRAMERDICLKGL